jgi:hypothetical protein
VPLLISDAVSREALRFCRKIHHLIHRFGQHDIGLHIDEHLGLEAGTYDGKHGNKTGI